MPEPPNRRRYPNLPRWLSVGAGHAHDILADYADSEAPPFAGMARSYKP